MGWLNNLLRNDKPEATEEIPIVGQNTELYAATYETHEATKIEAKHSERMKQVREEKSKKEKEADGLKLVIDQAKLECKLCSNPQGTLKVNLDTPTTQDKKTATVAEKDIKSLLFTGNCTKSPNSASPCAAVMQTAEWKDTGTLKVQDKSPLLLKSTIKCNYGGIDITITDCGQINEPDNIEGAGAPVPVPDINVDCIVEFTPLSSYTGDFGFDWLDWDEKDTLLKSQGIDIANLEYVFDKSKLEYTPVATTPSLKNKIKNDFTKQKMNVPYYVPWLSMLPTQGDIKMNMTCKPVISGSDISKNILTFEKNDYYQVIIDGNINEAIQHKPTTAPKEITIKCIKPCAETDIIVKTADNKIVGKIRAKGNIKVYNLPVRLVCLVKDTPSKEAEINQLISDFKSEGIVNYLNKNSLNQALIQTSVEIDAKYHLAFNESQWAGKFYDKTKNCFTNRKDSAGGKVSYIDDDGEEQKDRDYEHVLDKFLRDYKEKFEKNSPKFKGIILFVTNIEKDPSDKEGGVSRTTPVNFREAIIFKPNLKDKSTYAHEIGHILGLTHYFWRDAEYNQSLNNLKIGIIQNNAAIGSREANIKISESNIKIHDGNIKEYEEYQKKHPNYYKANPTIDKFVKDQKSGMQKELKEIKKSQEEIKAIEETLVNQENNLNVYKSNKFKFKETGTSNIMDYSVKTNYYSCWQWQLMQNDVLKFYGNII